MQKVYDQCLARNVISPKRAYRRGRFIRCIEIPESHTLAAGCGQWRLPKRRSANQ